ncbi:MAG: uracil-DNA glycosylase, partial [Chloroflexi bacterium]|nr:uracil-DNA glycosylase [Chloroflexota bacterium]
MAGSPTLAGGVPTLEALQRRIAECVRCPRLVEYRETVGRLKRRSYRDWTYWSRPVPSFGDPEARVAVIGLAPAAHGGNRTGRMFTGDASASFLMQALHEVGFANQPTSEHKGDGLRLRAVYITTAARRAAPC